MNKVKIRFIIKRISFRNSSRPYGHGHWWISTEELNHTYGYYIDKYLLNSNTSYDNVKHYPKTLKSVLRKLRKGNFTKGTVIHCNGIFVGDEIIIRIK